MLNWITNHKAMLLALATLWTGYFAGHVTIGEAISGSVLAAFPGLKIPGVTAPTAMVRQAPLSSPNPRAN